MKDKTVHPCLIEMLEGTYNRHVQSKVGDYAGVYSHMGSELVSSIDGVGTKVCIPCDEPDDVWPHRNWPHKVIGEDLVNHCINDILVVGARPRFFLNCFSYSSPRAESFMDPVLEGMTRAAKRVNMPVISGETACMKDFYQRDYYDVVGTIIGETTPMGRITGLKVSSGNRLIGIPSSGPHTNGFTLIRKIFCGPEAREEAKVAWKNTDKLLGMSVREAVMQPHRCYLDLVWPMIERFDIHAIAHVTGGGIMANLKRVINGHRADVYWTSIKKRSLFQLIRQHGDVSDEEMQSQFNLGIGMILVVSERMSSIVLAYLKTMGEDAQDIGVIS